ncbi:MAG: hypothetical protein EU532_07605 [Promethearchaeota archaeon]|nr:MAG: hypothetical protein EU532_07605 [Candidatus Lokiarchaeota archaeon]
MGIYGKSCKILITIPRIVLIEIRNSRKKVIFCGADESLKAGFAVESLEIAKLRIKEAEETGAEILVTSCVFCKRNLVDAAKSLNSKITVMNIEDILSSLLLH